MRSDDKAKDDISPPAGYGNRDAQRDAEANRQRAAAQAGREAEAQSQRERDDMGRQQETSRARGRGADQPTDVEIARYVFLRDKANRTAAEESEFDQLDARIDDPPPPLAPLTPAEVGKLAEQRADPAQEPDPDLVAREGVDQPPLGPEDRDPEKVIPTLMEVVDHICALLAQIISVVPMAHNHAGRLDQMREAMGRLVLHSSPEAAKPVEPKK